MNDCERIGELLERRLDGQLSATESANVQSHVQNCAACGDVQQRLKKIDGALKGVLAAEAAQVEFASFWSGIEHRLNARRPFFQEWRERWLVAPRSAWAVPAAIALLLAALSLDSYFPAWRGGTARGRFASVDSLDAHGRSVAVLRESETRTTVIWLYDEAQGEHETAGKDPKSGPAF